MLTEYIHAAMRRARYEIIEDDGAFYGEIPECRGVWASAQTLEDCRTALQEALEYWIVLGLQMGHALPEIDGLTMPTLKEAV